MANSADKTYRVTLTQKCGPGRIEEVVARNPPEARRFCESRFPGYTAHGANQVYN